MRAPACPENGELGLAEEGHPSVPGEVVLVERVRAAGVLAGALVALERVARSVLPEDVHLKLGVSLQPTLKLLGEAGVSHVQAWRYDGRERTRSGPAVLSVPDRLLVVEALVARHAGGTTEAGLRPSDGDDGLGRRAPVTGSSQ